MCEFYNVKNMWTIYQFAFILFCCVLHILFSSFSLQSNKSKFHKISIDIKRIFQHEQEPDSNEYIILWRSSSIGKMSLFLLYFVGILQCVIITVNIKIAWVYQIMYIIWSEDVYFADDLNLTPEIIKNRSLIYLFQSNSSVCLMHSLKTYLKNDLQNSTQQVLINSS